MRAQEADSGFVDLKNVDFSIATDLRYATKKNAFKKALYPEAKCALRKEVADALSRVQSVLKLQGVYLKVYDCYRPTSLQGPLKKWQCGESSDLKGRSDHSRGTAVDVTLVDRMGLELDMPSRFGDFSSRSRRDAKKISKKQRNNLKQLETAMAQEGFEPLAARWWHFDYKDWEKYPPSNFSLSAIR